MHTIEENSLFTTRSADQAPFISKPQLWTGRALSALAALFMVSDGVFKFVRPMPKPVADSYAQLGYDPALGSTLGTLALACTLLYVIPRTAVLGALLLTGYFGGAVATHLRVGNPLFSHVLFPTYIAVLVWGGLYLRDARLRALLNLRRAT